MTIRPFLVLVAVTVLASPVSAQWSGFVDMSDALGTNTFSFTGSNPEAGTSNENYYDGDMGDVDGDGLTDRILGSRYGLLFNTGGGHMVPARRSFNYLLRGDPGAGGWGEDAMQLADVDGDGDLDALAGGNGEPLTIQINGEGRFRVGSTRSRSALNIVNTDLENDGDVDFAVAHAFCATSACGGPVQFSLFENDGTGALTEVSAARGLAYGNTDFVVGVASGDVDRDGDFDLVIAHGAANELVVAVNDGTGSFTRRSTGLPVTGSGFGQSLNLGDIDDDGDLDIVHGRGGMPYAGGHAVIADVVGINDGTGNFADESAARFDDGGYSGGRLGGGNSKLGDLDYDGDLDYVSLSKNNMTGISHVQVFLNDGTGSFRYEDALSFVFTGITSGLGADSEITDLDGDGVYDVWVGLSGGRVRELINTYDPGTGVAADAPRNPRATAGTGTISISWEPPPFAATARYYRVYRSLAWNLADTDRAWWRNVGLTPYQDEAFSAPLTRHTTATELGDGDVTIDGTTGAITLVDRTALPGIPYHYAIQHVGPENTTSAHTADAVAMLPSPGGADTTPPELIIESPTTQSWSRYPRIVVQYADGGSGVDESTLSVSFDQPLGDGTAAGASLTGRAYRHDRSAFIAPILPPATLPADTIVTMTVSVSDAAGNTASDTVQFFTGVSPNNLPAASIDASPASGDAPLDVTFSADGSTDSDGRIVRWEWYFGDGATALGRNVVHTYQYGGTYDAMLLVRDDHGGVGTASTAITVMGMPPGTDAGVLPDGGTPGADGSVPGADGSAPGADGSAPGRDAGPGGGDDGMDGGCGCSVPASRGDVPWALLSLSVAAIVLRLRRRERAR